MYIVSQFQKGQQITDLSKAKTIALENKLIVMQCLGEVDKASFK